MGVVSQSSATARRRGPFWLVTGGIAVLVSIVLVAATGAAAGSRPPRLLDSGVATPPCHQLRPIQVRPAISGHFEPGSTVLLTGAGLRTGVYVGLGQVTPLTAAQSACAATTVAADTSWLAAGTVPGTSPAEHAMAVRALLDLKLAVQPDGAVIAGWHDGWVYSWPRDASWVAAALADTGHTRTALRALRFLARVQQSDGTWATRYYPDGAAVPGRAAELDAVGWVPWAVWSWYRATLPLDPVLARAALRQLWPMVTRAANAAARSLTDDGLPHPAMDYWENSTSQSTIETAAALLAGLRSAADLAPPGGHTASRSRWAAAAASLSAAIGRTYRANGYQRTPAGGGTDAALTLLGPPFAPASASLSAAVTSAAGALRLANGGMRPGTRWPGVAGVAWTPETAFFGLYDAETGQPAAATSVLNWLAAHRTSLGELPEQVNQDGQPNSVAPLSWTDAIVLLTLEAQQHDLTTVPVPGG